MNSLLPLYFLAGAIVVIYILVEVYRIPLIQRWLKRGRLTPTQKNFAEKWQSLEKLMATENEMIYRTAIMEADNMLDQALKSLSLPGVNLGERLKSAAYKYDTNAAWQAHRLRNRLAHESDFHLDKATAKAALANFKKALRILRALP